MAANNHCFTSAEAQALIEESPEPDQRRFVEEGPNFSVESMTYNLFECILDLCEKYANEKEFNEKVCLFLKCIVDVDLQKDGYKNSFVVKLRVLKTGKLVKKI